MILNDLSLYALCLKNLPNLTGYSFNIRPRILKNTFWHKSSADIQKSATRITFSTTSLLYLTLFCFEVKWQKWRVFHVTVIVSRERYVNMVFSADDKVLIKSLY